MVLKMAGFKSMKAGILIDQIFQIELIHLKKLFNN